MTGRKTPTSVRAANCFLAYFAILKLVNSRTAVWKSGFSPSVDEANPPSTSKKDDLISESEHCRPSVRYAVALLIVATNPWRPFAI